MQVSIAQTMLDKMSSHASAGRATPDHGSAKFSFVKLDPRPDPIHGRPCARSSHGLSLVNAGRRLVLYGGEHVARTPLEPNQMLWVADRIEDDEGGREAWQWRCIIIPEDEPQPPARVAHAQAVIDDQFVYVFGGRDTAIEEEAMNDLWKFDTRNLVWTKVDVTCADGASALPPGNRSYHKMVALNHSLYVFGGCGEHGRLADLHRFDAHSCTWDDLGTSPLLSGRGGSNLIILANDDLAAVAGFAGEETADGHRFDSSQNLWQPTLLSGLDGLRPRSVCVTGSYPSLGLIVIFGGEVDPSERGHQGAGSFANDIVLLDGKTAKYIQSIGPTDSVSAGWPEARGWSHGASQDDGQGTGRLYIFGGLAGDDANPRRLDDLWALEIESTG